MAILGPEHFENNFFKGWEISKKSAGADTLKWMEEWIAEKQKLVDRVHAQSRCRHLRIVK